MRGTENIILSASLRLPNWNIVGNVPNHLAGRFAAKEAVAKALGSGIGDVSWKKIEILGDEQNAPKLTLYGNAETKAQELGLTNWSVSISHTQSHSVAFVVAIG